MPTGLSVSFLVFQPFELLCRLIAGAALDLNKFDDQLADSDLRAIWDQSAIFELISKRDR